MIHTLMSTCGRWHTSHIYDKQSDDIISITHTCLYSVCLTHPHDIIMNHVSHMCMQCLSHTSLHSVCLTHLDRVSVSHILMKSSWVMSHTCLHSVCLTHVYTVSVSHMSTAATATHCNTLQHTVTHCSTLLSVSHMSTAAQEWTNRTPNATNQSIVHLWLLPGSQSSFTEIT